jgi:succinate dehydrogenase / fumarate reductase membrane anchor subunit
MSSQVTERPQLTTYGATARPAAGNGWETFSWWFFRISGVGLIFLAIIHLIIMHVTNDVSATGYNFVAQRYENPFWRGYDLLLLTLALFHGLNGLRIVIDDYVKSRGWRLAVQSSLFLIAVSFWLLGSMTIITFHKGLTVTQAMFSLFVH